MATTNPVFQVLTSSGNQAILAAGARMDTLAVGQIGVFNYHTGLSIDGSVPADAKDIFIAVGINTTGAGSGATLEDVMKSAGQVIQVRNAKSLTVKAYVDSVAKVVHVGATNVKCGKDYGIKIEFRSQKGYRNHGFNQIAKSFSARPSCQDVCVDCADGDCIEVVKSLVTQINNDPEKLVTASYFHNKITATVAAEPTAAGNIVVTIGSTAYTVAIVDADTVTTAAAKIVAQINTQTGSPYKASNVAGVITIIPITQQSDSTATLVYTTTVAGMTITPIALAKTDITDIPAFVAAYPGACLGIKLTGAADSAGTLLGGINLGYHSARGINLIVTPFGGYTDNSITAVTATELQYPEGSGYDVQQEEYIAGGWNGRPGVYRQSSVHGLERKGIQRFSSATANYTTVTLSYDQMSVGGWLEYLNNLQTNLYIPCADTTTLQGLFTVLDLIFTQFGAMTGDVAGIDCTNLATSTLTPATDGIESLT